MTTAAEVVGKDATSIVRRAMESPVHGVRQGGAVLMTWAQVGIAQSLNPAAATDQLCDLGQARSFPSLSFFLCIYGNTNAAFIRLHGPIYVACFLAQCLNHS